MVDLHFICDLPPIWEHTGARVILGEHVDGLSKAIELELEEGERIHSPLVKLMDGSRRMRLCAAVRSRHEY